MAADWPARDGVNGCFSGRVDSLDKAGRLSIATPHIWSVERGQDDGGLGTSTCGEHVSRARTDADTHADRPPHTHTHTPTRARARTHTVTQTRAHAHTQTRTRTHTHTESERERERGPGARPLRWPSHCRSYALLLRTGTDLPHSA